MTSPTPKLDDLRIERGLKSDSPWRILPVTIAIVVLVLAAATIWWLTRPTAIGVRTAMAREVISAGGDRTVLNSSGYVTARRDATVSSKITGKVTEILIEEGMSVKEGQVLARLDDTNVRASLLLARAQEASAQASLEETRVRLREAEQELKRQTDLARAKVATPADYDHAAAAALAYKARLEQQQADAAVAGRTIAIWQQQLEDTIIRAPFAGRISMDQSVLDVTGIPGVEAGDEVVILGTQGNEAITAFDHRVATTLKAAAQRLSRASTFTAASMTSRSKPSSAITTWSQTTSASG